MINFQLNFVLGAGLNAFFLDPKISKRRFKSLISKIFVTFTVLQTYILMNIFKVMPPHVACANSFKNIEIPPEILPEKMPPAIKPNEKCPHGIFLKRSLTSRYFSDGLYTTVIK